MNAPATHTPRPRPGGPRRPGFTMTELLVVISVIVLVIAMAVPLFNVFSTDRSLDSAENLVSAMLQRARARAIGLQERRGVMFLNDPKSNSTVMTVVKLYDTGSGAQAGLYVDIDPDLDEFQSLPRGVGAAFLLGKRPTNTFTTYGRIGLIVFDPAGRLEPLKFRYRATIPHADGDFAALLEDRVFQYYPGAVLIPPSAAETTVDHTQVGLVLYDRENFSAQPDNGNALTFSDEQSTWLDENALALFVNRYNGTIIRGE